MKNKILLFIICGLMLTSCGAKEESERVITETSRTVYVNDKDGLSNQLLEAIRGESSYYAFNIDERDICKDAEISQEYWFNGSLYMQIQNYMYRFQMTPDGQVISYIKYTLEA